MPWTTLVWITVLFSVIGGNRLMDNRLLRFSSEPDIGTLKTLSDDSELRDSLSNPPESILVPTSADNDFNLQLDLRRNRNCNNEQFINFLKNERNPFPRDEDTINIDSLPRISDLQIYENSKTLHDMGDNEFLNTMLATLPIANYKDFYDDLILSSYNNNNNNKDLTSKRNGNSIGSGINSAASRGCDCKIKNDLVDLGQQHFPRYLLNAVCHVHDGRNNDIAPKCWSGSMCRPLEYKVKVLTFRALTDSMQKDPTLAWLPDDLRPIWKFKTVTVTAGCFCS